MASLVTVAEALDHLNLAAHPPVDTTELELFIAAVTDHVADRYGTFPTGAWVEDVPLVDGWFRLGHGPVDAVTSGVETPDGTVTLTSGWVVSSDGTQVRHPDVVSGVWTVSYTTAQPVPAALKLAALEDIRGVYQPGQVGPPAAFGALGVEPDSGFRPVTLWPRVDAWVRWHVGPGLA